MIEREIAASVGQRLLWLLHEYKGNQGELNCPVLLRLDGPLDFARLSASLDALVARHEALRTTFVRRKRQLRQVIHGPRAVEIRLAKLPLEPRNAQLEQQRLSAQLQQELRSTIDPTVWPLRATLWQLAAQRHLLCLNLHHLVTDTPSCLILQRQLAEIYGGGARSQARRRTAPTWQFSQLTAWQTRQLEGEGFRRHRDYWSRQLQGASPLALPLGPRQSAAAGARATAEASLPACTATQLKRLAAQHGTTPFVLGLALFYTLLWRVTGQSDLAVATLFANRTRPETEHTVGFLSNLIVLRVRLTGVTTFAEVIDRARFTALDGMAHQELPFHLAARDPGSVGLDDVVFQMLGEPIEEVMQADDVQFVGVVPELGGRFDLELALMPRADELALKLYYTKNRVEPRWALQLLASYVELAGSVAARPLVPLTEALSGLAEVAELASETNELLAC